SSATPSDPVRRGPWRSPAGGPGRWPSPSPATRRDAAGPPYLGVGRPGSLPLALAAAARRRTVVSVAAPAGGSPPRGLARMAPAAPERSRPATWARRALGAPRTGGAVASPDAAPAAAPPCVPRPRPDRPAPTGTGPDAARPGRGTLSGRRPAAGRRGSCRRGGGT